jgi:hypothetical protein
MRRFARCVLLDAGSKAAVAIRNLREGDVDDLTIDERHALKKAIDLELKAMRKNV